MIKAITQISFILLIFSCESRPKSVYEYAKTVKNEDVFETTIKVVKIFEGAQHLDVTTNFIKRKYQTSKCFKTTINKEKIETSFAEFEETLLSTKFHKKDETGIDTISIFYGGNAYPEIYSEKDEHRRLKKFSKISKLIDVELLKNEQNSNISRMSVYPNINYSVVDLAASVEKIANILSKYDSKEELVVVKLIRSNFNNQSLGIFDIVYPKDYSGYFFNYSN